jgi:hypothetical protein
MSHSTYRVILTSDETGKIRRQLQVLEEGAVSQNATTAPASLPKSSTPLNSAWHDRVMGETMRSAKKKKIRDASRGMSAWN